jgi:GT2 family glycosyltransferase/glycosyltransferase involved in cell wall biosynthesis/SAM-dependent methyltransferase
MNRRSESSKDPGQEGTEAILTGERIVPGKVDPDLFNEHLVRYLYAREFCGRKQVLDTGCGVGYGCFRLAEVARRVVGIDNDAQALELARSHYALPNIRYVAGNCHQLPLGARSFDVVTSFELIEHLDDANAYLGEVRRVLRPKGVFLVSTPNRPVYAEHRGGEANPFHRREYEFDEFLLLLREYFSFVEPLGQVHIPAVGVFSYPTPEVVPSLVARKSSPEEAAYFLCVCSQRRPRAAANLVFVPASGNVLLERERHIRLLSAELSERRTYLARLQAEFDEKAAWADRLNSQVQEQNRLVAEFQQQVEERTQWAKSLDAELAERRAYGARLQEEFDEKAAWADRLNCELQAQAERTAGLLDELRASLDQKSAQLRERDVFLMALQAQLEHKQGLEQQVQQIEQDLQASQRTLDQQQQRIHELTWLWQKTTARKRTLLLSVLTPLDWLLSAVFLVFEGLGRLLRLVVPKQPPVFKPPDNSRCSIIVLSWEGKELLADSLPPLLEAVRRHGGDHEVIVLDNGSTDGTSEYVPTHFPQVKLVRSDQNRYYTGGNNLGVQVATGDIVVLLNNDMIVDPDFLKPLLKSFTQPDIFAVGCQVFFADPSKPREETGKTRAYFNGCDLDWSHEPILPADELAGYVPVFWGHGGAVAIDRRKFLWLGGLDTLYDPFYVEDADLSFRAWKVGWKCLLAVQSHVLHKHRGTNRPRYGERFISEVVRRNQYLFLWKNFSDLDMLLGHFLRLSRTRIRRAAIPGIGIRFEASAFLRALKRLPAILLYRLRWARATNRSDHEIFQLISAPPAGSVRHSEIDFQKGGVEEQLGSGWHELEDVQGQPFRWMARTASVFLQVPAERAELCIEGYVPSCALYGNRKPRLTISCGRRRKVIRLDEGQFSWRWKLSELPVGAPIRVDLTVQPTIVEGSDKRTRGVIVRRIGLLPLVPSSRSSQPSELEVGKNAFGVSVGGGLRSARLSDRQGRRILMVCAYMPCLGVHSGGNTMFHLIRTLSKRHRLTVLSFIEKGAERDYLPALTPYCEEIEVVLRGQSLEASNPFGIHPPPIVYEFYHRGMQERVREYLDSNSFDLIQCEFLQTAHLANRLRRIPAVLTHHEVLSFSARERCNGVPLLSGRRIGEGINWMRILNYEERILRRFSAVVVFTPEEREFLQRYAPGAKVYAHPTGVDTEFFSPVASAERGAVVFVGNFRHLPNVGGILWFGRQVWPLVRARYPGARLYIVGANPPADVRQMSGINQIVVTDWVEDIRPYLAQATVFVAPIFEGVGLRGKVLEAWSMGKPVVGTKLAFSGLVDGDGQVCFMANDPEEFASRVCRLLEEEDLARRMGLQGRQLAISSFAWEAFGQLYDSIYDAIVDGREMPASSHTDSESVLAATAVGRHS